MLHQHPALPDYVGGRALMAGATVSVIGAFLFRFLTVEFTNDHFVHLSRGWQILQGDVPIRDFFDPGLILQYYASAAALRSSGHNLLGEALLTTGFIAAGAGLTFVGAARLARSLWIASAATLVTVISTPRLYGYPKVFFYVLAIAGAWYYVRGPCRRAHVALAVITALAFLFRNDHGVYIGLAVLVLICMRHWGAPRQIAVALAGYTLVTLALVSPYLVFVQMTTGLVRHVGSVSPQVEGAARFRINWMPVTLDRAAPLLMVAPPAERRANVRWVSSLDDDARRQLERRHGLTSPEHIEDSTWSYGLTQEDRAGIGALIDEPAVADTHGIDRATRELSVKEPRYLRMQRQFPLLRIRVAPGLFSGGNALAWFYYFTLVVPFAGLALVGLLLWQGQIDRTEAAAAGMAAFLCVIIVQTLVRGSPDSRLADVAGPISVVAAWVTARARPAGESRPIRRRACGAIILTFWVVTLWSVGTAAGLGETLETSQILTGPSGVWQRLGVVTERLRARPIDNVARNAPGTPGLERYVFECTARTDRVFVTWFAPQLFFHAERLFAGGQVYLTAGWHASPADQELTIERLERQRVPIVLEQMDAGFETYFPTVANHVHKRYVEVPMQSAAMEGYRVLVDPRLTPTGTYEPLGLPCYR